MGLPFEQCRGSDADGAAGKDGASGSRTPGSSGQHSGDCPAAPRKRRPAPGAVSQQQRRDYYNGADIDDFFAAHNL